ncbi:hypothetical protein OC861_005538 [Tilletia horrida]|nr:hypothetical protein OC861_005538 [Tilletia horrida]
MVDSVQGKLVWSPTNIASTRIDRFRAQVESQHGPGIAQDYHQLWKWSCQHPDLFWARVWDEVRIISSRPYQQVITPQQQHVHDNNDTPSNKFPIYPPPHWFTGARLNFAENLIERHCRGPSNGRRTALIECTEAPAGSSSCPASFITLQQLTFAQLRSRVAKLARALRKRGVVKGDTVAVYGANCVATTVAFLAASSIGAVFVSAAADFAESGTLERLRLVRPKILFSVNAVRYNGKIIDHVSKLSTVVEGLESNRAPDEQKLELTVLADFVPEHPGAQQASSQPGWISFDNFLKEGEGGNDEDGDAIEYEQLDFDHPVWILFSSGTTGTPKAITHRAGGMLIQLAKEHLIHGGLSENDVFFPWGALVAGCPIILYDGSPLKPASVMWELANTHKITVFGTSASYLSALHRYGYRPKDHYPDLKLRQILSTGSPLRADLYPWILDAIGSDILIGSITGGTDICSLFAGHNEALPVRAGELQARNLGMDVDVFDDSGRSVGLGQEGDLVCKTPFPAQPLGFWRQPEAKYRDSYYSQFPGVWFHGDFCMLSKDGGLVMLGRSDGILNPGQYFFPKNQEVREAKRSLMVLCWFRDRSGGIRFGSSEIYEILENTESTDESTSFLQSIEDSLVVALKTPKGDDEVVVLFLVTKDIGGKQTDEAEFVKLTTKVKALVRTKRSARHVPAFVYRVSGVPKTLNGKRVEIPVKKLINGAPLSSINQATLLNPEVLNEYVEAGNILRAKLPS